MECSFLVAVIFAFINLIFLTNALDIDERCDPSRVPYNNQNRPGEYDYTRCDTRRGLYCNEFSRCSCYVADSYYDYYYRRCIAKVGYPCKATYTFTIPCGENAECPYETGFCQCRYGYFPTFDRRMCTNAANRDTSVQELTLVLLMTFPMLFTKLLY